MRTLFCSWILSRPNRTKLSFDWQNLLQQATQATTHRTSRRKQDLSIWLQAFSKSTYNQGAPFFVEVVFLQPSSNDVDDSFTSALSSEPHLCRTQVSCQVFEKSSRRSFHRETSRNLSHTLQSLAAVLLSENVVSEALTDPRDDGARHIAFGHDADYGVGAYTSPSLVPWDKASLRCVMGESPTHKKGERPEPRWARMLWRGLPAQSGKIPSGCVLCWK